MLILPLAHRCGADTSGAMPGKTPPIDCDGLIRIQNVVHDLRSPGGCPWDMEQTHQSLIPNLLEETYEVLEAIQNRDSAHMCEELGDLLLQVVIHGEIASESGAFDLDQIAHGIAEKLIRRHPHVYGDSAVADTAGVLRQWDEIKKTEKGRTAARFLDGVGASLPALMRAVKLQKKAAKVGFDWPDATGVIAKIREETAEVEHALVSGNASQIFEEVGDLLFSVANLARKLNLDPEVVLATANQKFTSRFHSMEEFLTKTSLTLETAGVDQMEVAWESAKRAEQSG